ncbi:MAG: POTRA domain-containing protein [Bacteroidales bacterium]|nr:POTRA domain-containing protein [Bacteroidales bacterium]
MKFPRFLSLFAILFLLITTNVSAQIVIGQDLESIDYNSPKEYAIGGVTVSGVQYLDPSVLVMLSNLRIGDKIMVPGEEISNAINKLWKQGLFDNVRIVITKIENTNIFLEIQLTERPRLSKFNFTGVKKSEADNLRDEIKLTSGEVVTSNLIMRTTEKTKKYFTDKGYLNAQVDIAEIKDTTKLNNIILQIRINKQHKIRINSIAFKGNKNISASVLKKSLKETKERSSFRPLNAIDTLAWSIAKSAVKMNMNGITDHLYEWANDNLKLRIFKSSKFIKRDYDDDKLNIVKKYNEAGFRDATIVSDTVYKHNNRSVNIVMKIDEGRKYYFRNIDWVGNTKYSNEVLNTYLKIKSGDIYNQELLQTNLSYNPAGFDVSSLYLDDGYLFFNVNPVEVKVENDSIDLEIRVYEGKQARLNKVTIKGNERTNDHVVIRELYTRPGELFNRSNIIRTQRELAQLRYFDAEKLGIDYTPNPADGTVDLEYSVEETSADQIELSGGWGYGRVIGTLGLSFNNFSARRLFKKDAWKPIPSGDGQKLALRFQTYGAGYMSYSASFTEPWLGGKKPNAFSVSYYHSKYTNSKPSTDTTYAKFVINGLSFSLGKRLKWPDDYFQLSQSINIQQYNLHNYSQIFTFGSGNGQYNNLSYIIALSRKSDDSPIFPRRGSELSLQVELTPPYSWFSGKDYPSLSEEKRYEWIEFHKWKFNGNWYTTLVGDLVLATKYKFAFLGHYNNNLGATPFERFYLGGDGLSGYGSLDGREIVALRGYSNESILPEYFADKTIGGTIFSKYTLEMRFPLSLNPSATIYALGYMEGGNTWNRFSKFNPFKVYRSAGMGIRIFLPMFGVLGLDWGYGFDEIPGNAGANGGQFHFSINQSID